MEGDAYYRIFAGVALSFLENDADAKAALDAISAKMSYTLAEGDITAKDDHCDVKKKVEAMYVNLQLDCDMVGVKSAVRALALAINTQVSRHCNNTFRLLAGKKRL